VRIELYTKERQKNGRIIKRDEKIQKDEFQLAASAIIKNQKNQFLITRRHPRKQMGLYWEFPGGAVEVGEESLIAVQRELYEEIGLKLNEKKFTFFETITYEPLNLLIDVYQVEGELKIENLVFQENEVIGAKFASYQEICQIYKENQFTPFDFNCLQDIMKRGN